MLLTTFSDTALQAQILWSANQVVHNPGHKGRVHQYHCHLLSQKSLTDGVDDNGKVKEHDCRGGCSGMSLSSVFIMWEVSTTGL